MSETTETRELPRMQRRYNDEMRAALREQFGYKNVMQVPRLEKIVINMGVGEAAGDQKKLDAAVAELTLIAGQRPVKTKAKKAIAGFKIREGLPIGWSAAWTSSSSRRRRPMPRPRRCSRRSTCRSCPRSPRRRRDAAGDGHDD